MRTNIELDDTLLAEAMKATGLPTKRATVEEALRIVVRQHPVSYTHLTLPTIYSV